MENRPTSISDLWKGKVTPAVKAMSDKTDAVLHGFNNKSEDESKGDEDGS